MIHFDAKHQKSEAKTKVKVVKIKQKIEAKRELSEKRGKKGKKAKKREKLKCNNHKKVFMRGVMLILVCVCSS